MSDIAYLYHQIAEEIRGDILEGRLKPGEKLPSVRQLTSKYDCTSGTVQRAYQELAHQGLVIVRTGKRSQVAGGQAPLEPQAPLRRAAIVNRSEAFLLESMAAGYSPEEVRQSVDLAIDHWQALATKNSPSYALKVRFYGSHDLAISWLSAHFAEIDPDVSFEVVFTGSLGALNALVDKKADLAGCHLWDEETNSYNIAYIHHMLPGQRVKVVTLVHRRVGLIVPPGNPLKLRTLGDLANPEVRFLNRQQESGTRSWLDAQLDRLGISPESIQGYHDERLTHSDVAFEIAAGKANTGVGLQQAANAFSLDFIPLARERYDLVMLADPLPAPLEKLAAWLATSRARETFSGLCGYDTSETGETVSL
jgi:putative molybdopterin biosynthesis protein